LNAQGKVGSVRGRGAKRDVTAFVCEKGGLFTYFLILILDSILVHNTRLIDAKHWGLERWEDGLYGKRKGIFVN
jgi:hypothetical protein